MRQLEYEAYAIWDNSMPRKGTVVDLLFDIPYLIGWSTPFPTRDQLNRLLGKGIYDAGMSGGCEWEPFEISTDEYEELVSAIKRDKRLRETPKGTLESSENGEVDEHH
jgi:hypothetical protein